MPKKRYTDGQIACALRQAEAGTPVGEICRKMGVTEATYYGIDTLTEAAVRIRQRSDLYGKPHLIPESERLGSKRLEDAAG
jgi:hypothetical protein